MAKNIQEDAHVGKILSRICLSLGGTRGPSFVLPIAELLRIKGSAHLRATTAYTLTWLEHLLTDNDQIVLRKFILAAPPRYGPLP